MFDRKLNDDDSRGRFPILPRLLLWLIAVLCVGCGTTRTRMATEQLLMSNAVDRAVAQIDFSPLRGKQVFFDTRYITSIKGNHFVNADYVISSLRQQMLAAGCLLQENMETAEYIIEGRCGALGIDGHEITYGIPASSGLSNAASMVPGVPSVPLIPEISMARRDDNRAAAKIGVFAYHRQSRMPVWQAGVVVSTSNARDLWLFGVGPFQTGTIHDGTKFAGNRLRMPLADDDEEEPPSPSLVSYYDEFDFARERRIAERRRRQILEAIHQMSEIPELMPISQLVFESSSGPRRLPPVELETGLDEPVSVVSRPEASKTPEDQAPADSSDSSDSSEAAGAAEADATDPPP